MIHMAVSKFDLDVYLRQTDVRNFVNHVIQMAVTSRLNILRIRKIIKTNLPGQYFTKICYALDELGIIQRIEYYGKFHHYIRTEKSFDLIEENTIIESKAEQNPEIEPEPKVERKISRLERNQKLLEQIEQLDETTWRACKTQRMPNMKGATKLECLLSVIDVREFVKIILKLPENSRFQNRTIRRQIRTQFNGKYFYRILVELVKLGLIRPLYTDFHLRCWIRTGIKADFVEEVHNVNSSPNNTYESTNVKNVKNSYENVNISCKYEVIIAREVL